jgi:hypothetical protein
LLKDQRNYVQNGRHRSCDWNDPAVAVAGFVAIDNCGVSGESCLRRRLQTKQGMSWSVVLNVDLWQSREGRGNSKATEDQVVRRIEIALREGPSMTDA